MEERSTVGTGAANQRYLKHKNCHRICRASPEVEGSSPGTHSNCNVRCKAQPLRTHEHHQHAEAMQLTSAALAAVVRATYGYWLASCPWCIRQM